MTISPDPVSSNERSDQKHTVPVRGYVEGYYGKLLSWSDRQDLVDCLASLQMNTFCYAPKEDPQHRLHWRESHSTVWHHSFARFCQFAQSTNASIVAGIAPGLNFNFDPDGYNKDFNHLYTKSVKFLDNGASDILVLWDDIEQEAFVDQKGLSEGTAHARVVNELSDKLGRPLWTTPRIYAAEIENNNDYLEDFFTELQPPHTVLVCGNAIVSENICRADLASLTCTRKDNSGTQQLKHRTVVWDNFYANDYCPRRLFTGPWTGRDDISEYLVNPTGMPHTDKLLLDIVRSTHNSTDKQSNWKNALERHGVPQAFLSLADYFAQPFFGDQKVHSDLRDTDCAQPDSDIEQAIEECLWKWKSPLAREWYPFIFGLKHDLALMQGTLPKTRILKTQTPCLANRLLR